MNKIRKIATCFVIGSTLVLAGKTTIAKAEEIPIAGITVTLDDFYQSSNNADNEIIQYLLTEDNSNQENLAFAQVTNYVNIRNKAGEDGEILGKLYNNAKATILEKDGAWYKVKSGSVTGYIKSDYLVTGNRAKELSKTVGTKLARVITTTLKVRDKASIDAPILTLVAMGDDLNVREEKDGWIKVYYSNTESGYVSADYVSLYNEYEEAVSIEEEMERLAEEQAALQEERRNNSNQTGSSRNDYSNPSRQSGSSNNTSSGSVSSGYTSSDSSSTSSLRSKIVQYALKFNGNPYVWGGTSLTRGTDCSGFTQSVFRDNGISIPRTSRTQASGGRKISIDTMRPGDLIFYARSGYINHVALYIGNGKVISASSAKTGIRISNYNYRTPYKVVSYID
jgi:peptidoglycan DL-endopeptidase CwlO